MRLSLLYGNRPECAKTRCSWLAVLELGPVLNGGETHEIGIVCRQCDAFNPLQASSCVSCNLDIAWGGDAQPSADGAQSAVVQPDAQAAGEEEPMEPARHYVCRSCSSAVPAGHKFCGRCGAPIPSDIRDMKTTYFGDMQNPTKAKLILIRGEGMDGLSILLKADQHIVGREGQLIFPDDPFVSPRHANFFYRDGSLVVRDEGSLNGVYIRIRGSVDLQAGQTFLAGEQLFRLEEVPPIDDDGPDEDGTVFYASPRKESKYRIEQVFRGGAVGMTVHSDGSSITVGRDGADLNFPEDMFISAEHCRVDCVSSNGHGDSKFTLTDLDSRYGTYIRIVDERALEHGDYVFIGRKLLRVEVNTN